MVYDSSIARGRRPSYDASVVRRAATLHERGILRCLASITRLQKHPTTRPPSYEGGACFETCCVYDSRLLLSHAGRDVTLCKVWPGNARDPRPSNQHDLVAAPPIVVGGSLTARLVSRPPCHGPRRRGNNCGNARRLCTRLREQAACGMSPRLTVGGVRRARVIASRTHGPTFRLP